MGAATRAVNSVPLGSGYKWVMLFGACFFAIMNMTTLSAYALSAGSLADAIGATPEKVMTVFGVWSIGQVISFLIGGWLHDKIGTKWTLLIGGICLVLPQFLIPHATSFGMIWALRFVQGFCMLAFVPLVVTMIGWFGPEQAALAIGFFIGATLGGGTLGNWFAGSILPSVGWVTTYYIIGVICAVSVLYYIILGKPAPRPEAAPAAEKRPAPEKVTWGKVLSMGVTWLCIITLLMSTILLYPYFQGMPLHGEAYGVPGPTVGTMSVILTAIFVVLAALSGVVVRAIARTKGAIRAQALVTAVGFVIMIVGVILFATLGTTGSAAGFFISALVTFGGMAFMMPPFNTLVPMLYPPEVVGISTGIVTFLGNLLNPVTPGVWLKIQGALGWPGYWLTLIPALVIGAVCMIVVYRMRRD